MASRGEPAFFMLTILAFTSFSMSPMFRALARVHYTPGWEPWWMRHGDRPS
jgi:hypothetical protein